MLVLQRRKGQKLLIRLPDGREVWITYLDARYDRVRLGIEAPVDVVVKRDDYRGEGANEQQQA